MFYCRVYLKEAHGGSSLVAVRGGGLLVLYILADGLMADGR
jgi:hypothetical protein